MVFQNLKYANRALCSLKKKNIKGLVSQTNMCDPSYDTSVLQIMLFKKFYYVLNYCFRLN